MASEFVADLHVKYVLSFDKEKEQTNEKITEVNMLEHLRLSGVYWGVTTLALLGQEKLFPLPKLISFILHCQQGDGGFGGNIGHDSNLVYTCHAILALAVCDGLDQLDEEKKEAVANYAAALQQPDGSFAGDKWLEIDAKYTYCALSVLSILKKTEKIDLPKAMSFIGSCKNFDGGFGNVPGCESHGGHIFTCIGSLAIGKCIDKYVNSEDLGWWLSERQCDSGGLNGRPEKQSDVCYSWWDISALIAINKLHWIDQSKLINFILECQDTEDGGVADRPNDAADIFHTFFGIGGLSLLGYFDTPEMKEKYPGFRKIHPVYAIPEDIVQKLNLS